VVGFLVREAKRRLWLAAVLKDLQVKIAQIAPLIESAPPRFYGGTERIVSYLTEELVRQGHEVTLFASGDSLTSAELAPCTEHALRLDPGCGILCPITWLCWITHAGGRTSSTSCTSTSTICIIHFSRSSTSAGSVATIRSKALDPRRSARRACKG
jgi:hypothetical protein